MKTTHLKLKYFLFILMIIYPNYTKAQDFNKFSIETNIGFGKPIAPFDSQYFSSKDNSYFHINSINHYDIGVRYMFSSRLGLRFGIESVAIKNASGSNSLPFKTHLYRLSWQGVVNLGTILHFDEISSRIGLLAHGGLQMSRLKAESGENKNRVDLDGGFVIGITPMVKLTERFVFTTDFSFSGNYRQHFNWDGSYAEDNNLFGMMNDLTVGITYYFGKNERHADWYENDRSIILNKKIKDYEAKIRELEQDTDKDGIPDHIDLEKNTKYGVVVDSKGRTLTYDKSLVNSVAIDNSTKNSSEDKTDNSIITLENKELFFDNNQVNPNKESKKKLIEVILFLKKYPEKKAILNSFIATKDGDDFAKKLSLRRLEKVKEIMILYGIDKDRISLKSKGIEEIMEADNKINALDLVRRVIITIQ